jgi:hypothetical protein
MRELRNGAIASKRDSTRVCYRKEQAGLQNPNNASMTSDCPSSRH